MDLENTYLSKIFTYLKLCITARIYSRNIPRNTPVDKVPNLMRKFLTQFQAVLNETSYGLHRLTQRQGLIKEFDIILPKSWHVPSCEPGRQMTSVQRANPARPDIFVDAKAADNRGQTEIGPRPWTEQPQGCGQPGFAIHMPSSFLSLEEKAPFYKDSWELRTKGKRSSKPIQFCSQ